MPKRIDYIHLDNWLVKTLSAQDALAQFEEELRFQETMAQCNPTPGRDCLARALKGTVTEFMVAYQRILDEEWAAEKQLKRDARRTMKATIKAAAL